MQFYDSYRNHYIFTVRWIYHRIPEICSPFGRGTLFFVGHDHIFFEYSNEVFLRQKPVYLPHHPIVVLGRFSPRLRFQIPVAMSGAVGTVHATGKVGGDGGGSGGGGGGGGGPIQSSDWECLKCGKSNYKNASACDRWASLRECMHEAHRQIYMYCDGRVFED